MSVPGQEVLHPGKRLRREPGAPSCPFQRGPRKDEDKAAALRRRAQWPPPWASWHGEGRGGRHAVLTHAGVPVPVEVVAGPAGAAVATDAVLAAVLARRGQALVRIWGAEAGGQRP